MLAQTREAVATPEAVLICQTTLLASLSLPAFLYDDFGDLVAANTRATRLVGLSRETLEADASWQDARYHTMRVVCGPGLGLRQPVGRRLGTNRAAPDAVLPPHLSQAPR